MAGSTVPHNISYPTAGDRVKDQSESSKLAADIQKVALDTNDALTREGKRAELAATWDYTEIKVLSSTADVYSLPPKLYRFVSNTAAEGAGMPSRNYGTLEVLNAGPQGKTLVWHPASSDQRFYKNVRVGASNWTGWEEYRPHRPNPAGSVEREMRVAQANARRGGVYGTGGLAVLAMGFDHGTNKFISEVVPILKESAVPAMVGLNSQMYDPSYMFHDTDSQTTWTQLQAMALNNGVSIWNHGRFHNAGGEAEIIGGRDELQDSLPKIPIESWLHTGTYGDFQSGNTFPNYWENDIGAVIMNSHAYLTGDIQEPIKPLSGQLKPGYDGEWIDNGATPLARVVSLIQKAQKQGGAVFTRLHPMYLNEPGRITTAQLRDFVRWAAVERDAGRLLVLTPDMLNLADSGRTARRNLTDGSGGAGNRTHSISTSDYPLAVGSVNEAHAKVRLSSAGTVRIKASLGTDLNAEKVFTVPANTTVDIRQFFTIPIGTAGTLFVAAQLVTGAGLMVEELNVYPG